MKLGRLQQQLFIAFVLFVLIAFGIFFALRTATVNAELCIGNSLGEKTCSDHTGITGVTPAPTSVPVTPTAIPPTPLPTEVPSESLPIETPATDAGESEDVC